MNLSLAKQQLEENGYSVLESIYTNNEIEHINSIIEKIDNEPLDSIKTNELFSIRKLLIILPKLKFFLINDKLKSIIDTIGGTDYFISKAIYFDKPPQSNWFVPFHQDISISLSNKVAIDGYTNWTFKKEQYGVQPPLKILENIFTIRIHLDCTTKDNGALKVLPNTHREGVIRNNSPLLDKNNFKYCPVNSGGVMLMKPLLFHASNRTTNNKIRRVIHLEFSNKELAKPLRWLEKELL